MSFSLEKQISRKYSFIGQIPNSNFVCGVCACVCARVFEPLKWMELKLKMSTKMSSIYLFDLIWMCSIKSYFLNIGAVVYYELRTLVITHMRESIFTVNQIEQTFSCDPHVRSLIFSRQNLYCTQNCSNQLSAIPNNDIPQLNLFEKISIQLSLVSLTTLEFLSDNWYSCIGIHRHSHRWTLLISSFCYTVAFIIIIEMHKCILYLIPLHKIFEYNMNWLRELGPCVCLYQACLVFIHLKRIFTSESVRVKIALEHFCLNINIHFRKVSEKKSKSKNSRWFWYNRIWFWIHHLFIQIEQNSTTRFFALIQFDCIFLNMKILNRFVVFLS